MFIGLDPGTTHSAFVHLHKGHVQRYGKIPNEEMLKHVKEDHGHDQLVVEMIASYGLPVGAEVFQTCIWIGRFFQASFVPVHFLFRKDVKMHLCHTMKGVNDAVIRRAIMDRYGSKGAALGSKAAPGPLFGIKSDCWAALAVALTWSDQNRLG